MNITDAKMLDFIQGLYRFQSVADLTERVCEDMPDLIGAENAMVCTHDGSRKIITSVSARHPFSRANLMPHINESGIMALHPFWESIFDPRQPARALSDVVSRRVWHRNPLYAEVFRPDGIEDQMNIELVGDHQRFISLNVLRGRRGFTDHERDRFLRLSSLISQAFKNARLAEQAGLVHAPNKGMLRIRVNTHGLLLPNQHDTQQELHRFFGLKGALPAPVMDWVILHTRKLNQGLLEHIIPPLMYRHGFQQWVFSLHRDFSEYNYTLSARTNACDAEATDLSPREQQVIAAVADGRSNDEIARALNVSLNTVKTHLKRAFLKLEATNRTEAAKRWRQQQAEHYQTR